jgi:hypothetical protein
LTLVALTASFQRSYAALLGLDLASGVPVNIATATGTFRAYGHAVTISVFDFEWEAVVYFAEPETFSLDVLGRFGFLDRLRVAIIDHDELRYLASYGWE